MLSLYLSFVVFPTIILLQILHPSFSKEELQVLQKRTVHGRWRGASVQAQIRSLGLSLDHQSIQFFCQDVFYFYHISTRLDESASQSGQGFEGQSDTDSLQGLNTRGQGILLICGENWMDSVFCPSAKQGSARYKK